MNTVPLQATEDGISLPKTRYGIYSKMTPYGELINVLPIECKKLIKLRESIIKKIINAELSITFNQTCIRENLLPAYTRNIYIYIYIYI